MTGRAPRARHDTPYADATSHGAARRTARVARTPRLAASRARDLYVRRCRVPAPEPLAFAHCRTARCSSSASRSPRGFLRAIRRSSRSSACSEIARKDDSEDSRNPTPNLLGLVQKLGVPQIEHCPVGDRCLIREIDSAGRTLISLVQRPREAIDPRRIRHKCSVVSATPRPVDCAFPTAQSSDVSVPGAQRRTCAPPSTRSAMSVRVSRRVHHEHLRTSTLHRPPNRVDAALDRLRRLDRRNDHGNVGAFSVTAL